MRGTGMLNCNKENGPTQDGPYFDLGHLFERIVRSWGAARIQYREDPFPAVAGLSMERRVALSGTLNGTLVLRSSDGFLDWLQAQRGETPLGRYPKEEIFEEMVSLFCLYLFHDFWKPLTFQIGPIRPQPSTPQDWPGWPPHASRALWVEGEPVEIRLWMKD